VDASDKLEFAELFGGLDDALERVERLLRRPDAVARLRPAEVDFDTAAAAPMLIGRELDGGRGGLSRRSGAARSNARYASWIAYRPAHGTRHVVPDRAPGVMACSKCRPAREQLARRSGTTLPAPPTRPWRSRRSCLSSDE
jgi:hypothetical protein